MKYNEIAHKKIILGNCIKLSFVRLFGNRVAELIRTYECFILNHMDTRTLHTQAHTYLIT